MLNVELMSHQKDCLSWMLFRERQEPPGGILADDMGLGKTLSAISLIAHQKSLRLKAVAASKRKVIKEEDKIYSQGTLVVAPASLINQWAKEVEDKVRRGALSVYVFHGAKEQRESNPRT